MFQNKYKNKKVLITGHTGFKGSWLAFWLKELGAEVYGIALEAPTEPSNFKVLSLEKNIASSIIDIKQLDLLKKKFAEIKPEIVFHLGAKAIVHDCYQNPVDAFHTNLLGTVHVLEAIKAAGSVKAAIMITSDKCYQNVEWEYGYRETDRLGGDDPYSASKACAEIAIHSYVKSYFNDGKTAITSVRAGNVIGGGDWAAYRIIPDAAKAWGQKTAVKIRSPHATRPWQHVLEPLSGYLLTGMQLLENKNLHGESFNFGPEGNQNASVLELLQEIKKYWPEADWQIETLPNVKKEAMLLKLSIDKANHLLKWVPTLQFTEVAKLTAEWYQAYYQKQDMQVVTRQQLAFYNELAVKRNLVWTK